MLWRGLRRKVLAQGSSEAILFQASTVTRHSAGLFANPFQANLKITVEVGLSVFVTFLSL